MAEKFTIIKERQQEQKSLIRVEVNIHFENDAPPSLIKPLMKAIGELIAVGLDEETCEEIYHDLIEIHERKQREADNIARLLLGDDDQGENNG